MWFSVLDVVDIVFRLFVGLEYECPRGHRFFLCAPDRLFKVPPSGIYKVLSFCTQTNSVFSSF